MNVSTTPSVDVSTDLVETTRSAIHIVVVPNSASWHLTVGVVVKLVGLVLAIVTAVILIHEYTWSLDERRKKAVDKHTDTSPSSTDDIKLRSKESFKSLQNTLIQPAALKALVLARRRHCNSFSKKNVSTVVQ